MMKALTSLVLAGLSLGSISATSSSPQVKSWLTQANPQNGEAIYVLKETDGKELKFDVDGSAASATISINSNSLLQKMEGFGAGLPQASAYVLSQLKINNKQYYDQVMTNLFSKEKGIGMSMIRFPIGSCDFSLRNTSYDEVKDDYDLKYFAIDADSEYIVSVLLDAKTINPGLQIIASPWSAPSWLKTLGTLIPYTNDNTLIDNDQVYDTYARYFRDVIRVYRSRGLHIDYLTLQNEPLFGDSKEYPGMYLSADQARRLAQNVRKYISTEKEHVQILSFDHNWDQYAYPLQTSPSDSDDLFDAVAWHCYGGDMATAQDAIHAALPSKPQHVTECTGSYPNDTCDISQGMTGFGYNHEWDMANIFLGATGHYAVSGVKWILALDEHCGPTLPAVTYKNGRPLVSIPTAASSFDTIKFNQDYWTIAHMSKFIPTGAHRVVSTVTSSSNKKTSLLTETFLDATTNTLSCLVMNLDHTNAADITVQQEQGTTAVLQDTLPPFSTKIYQWKA